VDKLTESSELAIEPYIGRVLRRFTKEAIYSITEELSQDFIIMPKPKYSLGQAVIVREKAEIIYGIRFDLERQEYYYAVTDERDRWIADKYCQPFCE
jgi:hypothetical protein